MNRRTGRNTGTGLPRPPWPVAGIVLAIMALIYGPIVYPFDPFIILGRTDLWNYLGPMAFFMDHTIHHGEWPQWNPLLFCGTPFAANPQAALWYPLHLLRAILNVHPTPMRTLGSIAIMQGVHLFILAMGTFHLARSFHMKRLGALVAAVGYMSSGAIAFRLVQHWHFVAIAAWLPWQWWLLRRALLAEGFRRKAWYGLAGGLLFGIGTLPGFPQLTVYAGALLGFYWVLHRLACHDTREARFRAAAGDLLVLACMFGVGILIAMPSLLPSYEFSTYSVRAKQFGETLADACPLHLNPFQHPSDLAKALVLFCGKQGVRLMGATAALLVLCSLRHRRRREVTLCAVLFLIFLNCSVEPAFPFGWLVSLLSPFYLTEPQRAIVLASLCWALLAGFGADALVSPARSRYSRAFWFASFALAGSVCLGCLLEWIYLNPEYHISIAAWLLPALAFLMMALAFHRRYRAACGWLVFAAFAGEAALWNHAYITDLIRDNEYPGEVEALDESPGFHLENRRWIGGTTDPFAGNILMYALKPVINGYDPLTIERVRAILRAPSRDTRYNRRIQDWEVTRENPRATMFGKRRFRLADDIPSPTPAPATPDGLPFFSPAREAVIPFEPPLRYRETGAPPNESLSLPLLENHGREQVLCIAYRAESAGEAGMDFYDADTSELFPGKTFAWNAASEAFTEVWMPLPDFTHIRPRLKPHLDTPGKNLEIGAARVLEAGEDDARIAITESAANHVSVRLDALPRASILYFMEARYPGWHAFLDGSPITIEPAFDAFQQVRVPGGTHTVTFAFNSWTVKAGMVIGAVSLLMVCVAMSCLAYSLRRPSCARGGATPGP